LTLEDALKEISKQSGYDFVFGSNLFQDAKPVSLDLSNVSLKEALERCFLGQSLTYAVVKNIIVVKKRAIPDTPLQQKMISGIVVDSELLPLPGVSITVKGTSQGAVTDNEGRYNISIQDNERILVFSFIGF